MTLTIRRTVNLLAAVCLLSAAQLRAMNYSAGDLLLVIRKDASPPPKINRIAVDAAGVIRFNDRELELPQLKENLLALKAGDPETSVVVKGAPDVDYQRVIGVLDVLQQADVTRVGLATDTAP